MVLELGNGGTIRNGSIGTTPLTIPSFLYFTFDGVEALSTSVTINDRGTLAVRNSLTLDNATITLASSDGQTFLLFRGPDGGMSMLDGTGEILFGGFRW